MRWLSWGEQQKISPPPTPFFPLKIGTKRWFGLRAECGTSGESLECEWAFHSQSTKKHWDGHIKFRCFVGQGFRGGVKVRTGGGTKHWWDHKTFLSSFRVPCPPNHHHPYLLFVFFLFLSFTVFLFSVYVSFCGWLNHPFTPSKFLKNKLRGDHLEEQISASFLVDFPVCFTWSRSPHADRQERERGTEEKGERWYLPPKPRTEKQRRKGTAYLWTLN